MMKNSVIQEYCTGCGLCSTLKKAKLVKDHKGFLYPIEIYDPEFCNKICPSSGSFVRKTESIWGDFKEVYLGYSTNKIIRNAASSGGVLTEISLFLLDEGLVDGVIQTKVNENNPTETITVLSRNNDDVIKCMGSRYSISNPLKSISELVKEGEKYAFVGKPCDVMALKQYLDLDFKMKEQIVYLLSFFCAGVPSVKANQLLVKELGCDSINDCVSLTYRGNGWPGYATATNKSGEFKRITYDESWGKILGRDVRKMCRFCIDGTGDAADIACGDAWYLTPDGKPDFTEHDGRNVIFVRTEKGARLLEYMQKTNRVSIRVYNNFDSELRKVQYFQFSRKATMRSMLFAMRLFNKGVPNYDRKTLKCFSRYASKKEHIKRFLGVSKRIVKGKV